MGKRKKNTLRSSQKAEISGGMFLQIQTDIYGYKYIFRSNSRGSRYARAFAPTDLLTSLREE